MVNIIESYRNYYQANLKQRMAKGSGLVLQGSCEETSGDINWTNRQIPEWLDL